MLLSDRDILAAQSAGHISLDPWTPEMVQPASIDVRRIHLCGSRRKSGSAHRTV